MSLADYAMLVATALPYVWVLAAKASPAYSNRSPRAYLERVEGWRKRANWAQANAWEAFAPFAAAVLLAEGRGGDQHYIDAFAGVFVLARVAHGAFYIADRHLARSGAWTIGILCVAGLYAVAAAA